MFSYIPVEKQLPKDHPIRKLRPLVDIRRQALLLQGYRRSGRHRQRTNLTFVNDSRDRVRRHWQIINSWQRAVSPPENRHECPWPPIAEPRRCSIQPDWTDRIPWSAAIRFRSWSRTGSCRAPRGLILTATFRRFRGPGSPRTTPANAEVDPGVVDTLTAPAFADTIGVKLGIGRLGQFPSMVSICRHLSRRHGTIHTDSACTVAIALVYFNTEWNDAASGCLRFLAKVDDIDATVAPEVKLVYGEFMVFKHAENSFHGFLPTEGKRRVIKVAWLTSEVEKQRKMRRGNTTRFFKQLTAGWTGCTVQAATAAPHIEAESRPGDPRRRNA